MCVRDPESLHGACPGPAGLRAPVSQRMSKCPSALAAGLDSENFHGRYLQLVTFNTLIFIPDFPEAILGLSGDPDQFIINPKNSVKWENS